MDSAISKYLDLFPVLRAFGDLVPDPVLGFLKALKNPEHPSGIARAQLETPMMKQFASAKVAAADALLFFRMGDFFELFGLDAVVASLICRLTLTSRDKGAEDPIPMAGVPVVSYKAAIKKCVDAGFKVAICDQVEDPKDTKLLVRREIVRIITPAVAGDLFDEDESSPAGSFLAAVAFADFGGAASTEWTIGALDAATGEFRLVSGVSRQLLHEELLALSPREILLSESNFLAEKKFLAAVFQRNSVQTVPSILKSAALHPHQNAGHEKDLETIYADAQSAFASVVAFPAGAMVASALFRYIKETQRAIKFHWKPAHVVRRSETLCLDHATKLHLNLLCGDGRRHSKSFFDFLNHCATAHGRRKLYERLSAPYVQRDAIEKSLNIIEAFLACRAGFMNELRSKLAACADLDRILGRLVLHQATHRELIALRRTLRAATELAVLLEKEFSGQNLAASILELLCPAGCFFERSELLEVLEAALAETGLSAALLGSGAAGNGAEGGVGVGGAASASSRSIFNRGYNKKLDELLQASSTIDAKLAELQTRERELSGISTLKVGFNKVFGYFIEVSKGRADRVPAHFVRKQTLANAERYITQELKELEEFSLNAEDERIALEKEIFLELVAKILASAGTLSKLNESIALIDLQLCLAKVSDIHRFAKPTICEAPVTLLRGVIHPVVAAEMQRLGQGFVPNDLAFGRDVLAGDLQLPEGGKAAAYASQALKPILLITGPNMAGKSTIMRQVALVHILAQMGCYVPCSSATVGICDAIFTRIGASDDLLGARSTFMVEMSETAQILKQLTPRSLILMDEIGRGTSTFDGLSLAWSILEELDGNASPRTLFSTHYHELSVACESLQNTRPMQVEVLENPSALGEDDAILFTHRLVDGAARESYGIHVARMAGLPKQVIERAGVKLLHLLKSRNDAADCEVSKPNHKESETQHAILGHALQPVDAVDSLFFLEELKNLDLNALTPLQVMNLCASWQKKLLQGKGLKSDKGANKGTEKGAKKGGAALSQPQNLMDPLF